MSDDDTLTRWHDALADADIARDLDAAAPAPAGLLATTNARLDRIERLIWGEHPGHAGMGAVAIQQTVDLDEINHQLARLTQQHMPDLVADIERIKNKLSHIIDPVSEERMRAAIDAAVRAVHMRINGLLREKTAPRPPPPEAVSIDIEIAAIQALAQLSAQAQLRVIHWAQERLLAEQVAQQELPLGGTEIVP
jgi:hypothetical protein